MSDDARSDVAALDTGLRSCRRCFGTGYFASDTTRGKGGVGGQTLIDYPCDAHAVEVIQVLEARVRELEAEREKQRPLDEASARLAELEPETRHGWLEADLDRLLEEFGEWQEVYDAVNGGAG